MKRILSTMRKTEEIMFLLRSVYEQYGYEKFRMGKFEEYDFYTEHKDFLSSGQILTFTDLSGKLMALKPDVTMSIVKRTKANMRCPERLYYSESIYRAAREVKEYKEIPQMGLEYIGHVSPYINAEIVTLARKSLQAIDTEYVLDISHMGFITGLFEEIDVPHRARQALLQCLEAKNTHEIAALLQRYDVDPAQAERLCALAAIGGKFEPALERAQALACNTTMHEAVEELKSLRDVFAKKDADTLRLDFSITLDSKYYNGLMFRGYLRKAPRAVLSGGRYDLLLRRMGIMELEAIGFAIYFDEVERHLRRTHESLRKSLPTAIVLVEDAANAAYVAALHAAVEELIAQGKRVVLLEVLPETQTMGTQAMGTQAMGSAEIYTFNDGKLEVRK